MRIIQAVPTNIITGFLGVGKTTAINHLLKSKPANERWAVLVNEFGEVGVDASLINGQSTNKDGIFIKEVAGGCMCCTSGLPMQVALNVLLTQAKPHRLLIEPTGLGHPAEVLETLSQPHYQKVISLGATITLVDARHVHDARYTSNDTFNEQLRVADIIIANKTDLYAPEDLTALKTYCQNISNAPLKTAIQATLNWRWLLQDNAFVKPKDKTHAARPNGMTTLSLPAKQASPFAMLNATADVDAAALPDCGYVQVTNAQDDFASVGWRFAPHFVFNRTSISVLLMGMSVMRAKAVCITDEGVFGYNKTPQGLTEVALEDALDSRIEIINESLSDDMTATWQAELLAAAAPR